MELKSIKIGEVVEEPHRNNTYEICFYFNEFNSYIYLDTAEKFGQYVKTLIQYWKIPYADRRNSGKVCSEMCKYINSGVFKNDNVPLTSSEFKDDFYFKMLEGRVEDGDLMDELFGLHFSYYEHQGAKRVLSVNFYDKEYPSIGYQAANEIIDNEYRSQLTGNTVATNTPVSQERTGD